MPPLVALFLPLLPICRAFVTSPAILQKSHINTQDGCKCGALATELETRTTRLFATAPVVADVWNGWDPQRIPEFLKFFWQQRPLLIRQAFTEDANPAILTPQELADLSRADDVESRIIRHSVGDVDDDNDAWSLESGPFDETDFAAVDGSSEQSGSWTLLVNEVNRHVPEASDLLQQFAFLPSWRVDDLMASHAPRGGGIGPHVDSYDVFLLQVGGSRRWSIEERLVSVEEEQERLVPGIDVRILRGFKETQAWVLQPGDMLYLPPRVPHNGVSTDDECVTYSIGFKAPSHRELVTYFSDAVASQRVGAGGMYTDAGIASAKNPGLITKQTVSQMRGVIRDSLLAALEDDTYFRGFLGKLLTTSKRDHFDYPAPPDENDLSMGYRSASQVLDAVVRAGSSGSGPFIYRAEGLCFAYMEDDGEAALFIDGKEYPLPKDIAYAAPLLCAGPRLTPAQLAPALGDAGGEELKALLEQLLNAGLLYPADD